MLERFRSHPHLSHYLLHGSTFLLLGFQITGLGPIIPYMADEYGYKETEYSFLFSCRSFGMLLGCVLCKYLQHLSRSPSNHALLMAGCLGTAVTLVLFTWATTLLSQGIWFFIASILYAPAELIPNICLIMINPAESMEFWLLISHGMFGVGALLGPFFVYFFELNAFLVSGMTFLVLLPFLYYLPSPEHMHLPHAQEEKEG